MLSEEQAPSCRMAHPPSRGQRTLPEEKREGASLSDLFIPRRDPLSISVMPGRLLVQDERLLWIPGLWSDTCDSTAQNPQNRGSKKHID